MADVSNGLTVQECIIMAAGVAEAGRLMGSWKPGSHGAHVTHLQGQQPPIRSPSSKILSSFWEKTPQEDGP